MLVTHTVVHSHLACRVAPVEEASWHMEAGHGLSLWQEGAPQGQAAPLCRMTRDESQSQHFSLSATLESLPDNTGSKQDWLLKAEEHQHCHVVKSKQDTHRKGSLQTPAL